MLKRSPIQVIFLFFVYAILATYPVRNIPLDFLKILQLTYTKYNISDFYNNLVAWSMWRLRYCIDGSGFKPGSGKLSPPRRPTLHWGLPSLLFNGYGVLFRGVKLPTHLHLEPKLRMGGAIFLFFHTPSWHGHGQIYLTSEIFTIYCQTWRHFPQTAELLSVTQTMFHNHSNATRCYHFVQPHVQSFGKQMSRFISTQRSQNSHYIRYYPFCVRWDLRH
jgi:hypothetical protein